MAETQLDFITTELKKHILRHQLARKSHRRVTATIRVSAILLTFLITVLLGIKGYIADGPAGNATSIAALVASALLTSLTAWENFADTAGRWVRRRALYATMLQIHDGLSFYEHHPGGPTEQQLDDIYQRMRTCLADENAEWGTRRAKSITTPLTSQPTR
jgi:hypothetical protein